MDRKKTNIPGNNDTEPRRVLIVAGGTGGHIAPALAVGDTLRISYGPNVMVRYLTGSRSIERQAFAAAEEFPDSISCDAAPRLSITAIPSGIRYIKSVVESLRVLRRFRPQVILATGGYVCAPVLTAARMLKIPFYLHESNAVPGFVTRLFAKQASRVFIAHDKAKSMLKAADCANVGTPVRRAMFLTRRDEAFRHFDLKANKPTLLVLGGSQGAHAVNEAVADALPLIAERFASTGGLQVIWACGPLNYNTVRAQLDCMEGLQAQVRLYDFLREMHYAYAACDLVVSRAGASSLAEITALGLPSLLIPYPHAKDNHQYENARSLVEQQAAEMIEETQMNGRKLALVAGDLLLARERCQRMADAARRAGAPRCSEAIARILMDDPRPLVSEPVEVELNEQQLTA